MRWPAWILAPVLATATSAQATTATADLKALADPAKRDAEVARLIEADGKKAVLATYHLIECPQASGNAPLHLLSALKNYDFGSSFHGPFWVVRPEELFAEAAHPPVFLKPDLNPIPNGSDFLILDDAGASLESTARSLSNTDYLFDFNHDGMIEAVGSHSWDGLKGYRINVFRLQTVERTPRVLLNVVYNWAPEDKVNNDSWSYTCSDEDGDGRVEIAFGPLDATPEEKRTFVFRCDPLTGKYSAGRIPQDAHIRVLKDGETLEDLARKGGLSYPLERRSDLAPVVPAGKPYVFKSLRNSTAAEMIRFFQGEPLRDPLRGDDASAHPNRLPETFWTMSAKAAALALARENQGEQSRERWNLAIDDRGGVAPPASGWLVYSWNSALCYSFTGRSMAIRFGKDQSWLVTTENNFNGAVDPNPFADQEGHTCRCIPLSNDEARFLTDTIFWLHRIRGFAVVQDQKVAMSRSTADGMGSLYLAADHQVPVKLAEDTTWTNSWISGEWQGNYEPMVFLNLADHLLSAALKARLGDRWDVAPDLDRRDLQNTMAQRLSPRLTPEGRAAVVANIRRVFDLHEMDALPPPILKEVIGCIGGETMDEFLPDLKRLKDTLPPKSTEEVEVENLKDGYDSEHFSELQLSTLFQAGPVLRKALDDALNSIETASDPDLLKAEIAANKDDRFQALQRLRRVAPRDWAEQMIRLFPQTDESQQANLFNTLAAVAPEAAERLIEVMPPEKKDLMREQIETFQGNRELLTAATQIPELLRIVRDRRKDVGKRAAAINLLSGLPLDPKQTKEFTSLLLAEWADPQYDKDRISSTGAGTIRTLSRLLPPERFAGVVGDQPWWSCETFDAGVESIVRVFGAGSPRTRTVLESCLRPGFARREGLMSHFFMTALAFDLRGLAQETGRMASESATVQDGDLAEYDTAAFARLAGRRYHAAREVTAFWAEKDPATLGSMWICLAANRPLEFSERDEATRPVGTALRARAAEAIHRLPLEERKPLIDQALQSARPRPGDSPDGEVIRWLKGLGES